jgi:hypothetical protein
MDRTEKERPGGVRRRGAVYGYSEARRRAIAGDAARTRR